MLFSSTLFLFAFLPLVLSAYLLVARLGLGVPARNALLLVASLVFYTWGETGYVAILLVSIVANHVFGLWIDRAGTGSERRRALVLAVSLCAGVPGTAAASEDLVVLAAALVSQRKVCSVQVRCQLYLPKQVWSIRESTVRPLSSSPRCP